MVLVFNLTFYLLYLQAGLLDANGEIAGFQTVQAGGKGKFWSS